MASPIWLAYDLGVRGDYEGLYKWLDEHGAKECGDSVAFLKYEHTGSLHDALTRDLRGAINLSTNTRIYVVWRDTNKKIKGQFIIGGRKAAPWSGFASVPEQAEVDEE